MSDTRARAVAERAEQWAKDLAEEFEIALAPGWNRLYPHEIRTPSLWPDIHADAQACWLQVAKRAITLADQALLTREREARRPYVHALKRFFTVQNVQDVEQWKAKTLALLKETTDD